MIVWRITGDEIGPNGGGAAHFATKAEADKALREHRRHRREKLWAEIERDGCGSMPADYPACHGPEKIEVRGREDLAWHLDHAMGFGGS